MMPPPSAPFSYGKKYGSSPKLFVSGRRKTLKIRPKLHVAVPTLLATAGGEGGGGGGALGVGGAGGGRAKPLKRGSPLASKDSLRLKKKNKLLKVDDGGTGGGSSGGGGGGKRITMKARLL